MPVNLEFYISYFVLLDENVRTSHISENLEVFAAENDPTDLWTEKGKATVENEE